jgi:hypothetical protein
MKESIEKYLDIINMPHHVSKKHPQMSRYERAAQFAPFAALTGYEDIIKEEGRLTDNRIEIKQGCANKEPIIMKVRVGRSSRKFFNHKIDLNNLLLTKDWNGDFNSVETIYVIAINNHDYNI